METPNSNDMSSVKAVLIGALASGVNVGPTWFVVKATFLLLGLCLTTMLALAFSSSDFIIVCHVILLVTIGAILFILLNGYKHLKDRFRYLMPHLDYEYLAQTGLVSVEQQMKEMGISENNTEEDKRK